MVRKAPIKSSKSFKLGTIKTGLDKKQWIVVSTKGGGKRWKSLGKVNHTGGRIQVGPFIWGDKIYNPKTHKWDTTWKIDWSLFFGN